MLWDSERADGLTPPPFHVALGGTRQKNSFAVLGLRSPVDQGVNGTKVVSCLTLSRRSWERIKEGTVFAPHSMS